MYHVPSNAYQYCGPSTLEQHRAIHLELVRVFGPEGPTSQRVGRLLCEMTGRDNPAQFNFSEANLLIMWLNLKEDLSGGADLDIKRTWDRL